MKTLLATALCLLIMMTACSMEPTSNSTSTGVADEEQLRQLESTNENSELEQRLRRYQNGPSEYLVVIDKSNCFWAIPVIGIKEVVQNRVYLKGGTTVGMKTPSGTFNENEIAKSLINEMNSASSDSFSFTTDKNGKLISSGLTTTVRDGAVVVVIKIVTVTD
jgi:hypothetical protein